MKNWLRTDECEEAIAALEISGRFLREASNDPFSWRWVIMSFHIATQGFMVIALRDTAGLIPLRNDVAKKWMTAHRAGTSYPEERLDSFRNLYGKVKCKTIAELLQAKRFVPSGTQGASINRLCDLRDDFSHFLPRSWSLEVSGMPRICADICAFIEFLSMDYRRILWHNSEHPKQIQNLLQSTKASIPVLGGKKDER